MSFTTVKLSIVARIWSNEDAWSRMLTVLQRGCALTLTHVATLTENTHRSNRNIHVQTEVTHTHTHTPVSWTVDTPQESLCRLWRWEGWCLLFRVTVSWTRYRAASVWRRRSKERIDGLKKVRAWSCGAQCCHTDTAGCQVSWPGWPQSEHLDGPDSIVNLSVPTQMS